MKRLRIHKGRLQIWDDDPPENFGQIWITICAWCHNGPLNDSDGIVCGECGAAEQPGYGTSDGVELTDELVERLAREAEEGYAVERLRPRSRRNQVQQ